MSKNNNMVKQSDVTFWGAAALVAGAIAVLGANLPTLLPADFITKLHSSRMESGNINSLRLQVSRLQAETIKIRSEYARLATQITLAEQNRGQVTRRVGALESSIPVILQAVPPGVAIDSSISTAAIGNGKNTENYDVEGGSVSVSNQPLNPSTNKATQVQPIQTLPNKIETPAPIKEQPVIENSSTIFGIALGDKVSLQDAFINWQEIEGKVGTLLIGLKPVISGGKTGSAKALIAGPVNSYAEAEQLCTRMIRVGISCLPMPYVGDELPK